MKRYLLLLIIIPFLTGCGAGGGGGGSAIDSPGGGDNGTGNKTNPICSGNSNIAKIKVKEDGVYRVAYSALCGAGVDLSGAGIAMLKMTNQGKEIAIDVVDENNNGNFDDGDYIEFYGRAIQRGDKNFRFTRTNVYRLFADEWAGKRIEPIPSNPLAAQGPSSFLKVLHREEDKWYEQKNYPELTSPDEVREHWFWGGKFLGGDVREEYFSIANLEKNQPVSIKLHLQPIRPENSILHIKLSINNYLITEQTWPGQDSFDLEAQVPTSYLQSGPNKLRVESAGDLFYLDWFEVTYDHSYQAEHDELEFRGEGLMALSNFTSPDISIYEISAHAAVKKIVPVNIEGTPSGYKAIFSSPENTQGRFFALTASNKKAPFAIEAYTPAGLKSKNANYIIITHEDFYDAIKPLADYRNSNAGGGYKVLTVKVKDIYDEFSDGIEAPQSIKDFLKYAYDNWPTKPGYVLIVGDATVDYKDISGYGRDYGVKSYVPAYLYNLHGFGEVPSDNWFVDVVDNPGDVPGGVNDALPEINIGRIPAKYAADISAVVNKIISHENSAKSNNVLLIADDDIPIFETLSESIAGIISPNGYSVSNLYQRDYNGGFRDEIIKAINSGPLIVNYTGHGAVVDWTKEDVFSSKDVTSLTNKEYPFVVALNCLNGYFVLPTDNVVQDGVIQSPSIAESFLLTQDKGAVAVFAASAIGYPSEHDPLGQELYNIIFNQAIPLGEAVTKAKEAAYKHGEIMEDVVETFIFFGDPATRLR